MRKELTPFGENAKMALVEKRMSMEELALAVGISRRFLYLIFAGIRPGRMYLPKISAVLEIELPEMAEAQREQHAS